MKKLQFVFFLGFGLQVPCFVMAKEPLPFVGQTSSAFCGGNACEEIYEIKQDGELTISSFGTEGKFILYKGQYKSQIESGYASSPNYLFRDKKIYLTDKDGRPLLANENDCFQSVQLGKKFCETDIFPLD